MPRDDWRLCMSCTDPMECGSWATCFAPAHEYRWVVYSPDPSPSEEGRRTVFGPMPEPISPADLPCNWSVWRIP